MLDKKIYPPRTSSVITGEVLKRLPLPSLFFQVKLDGKCMCVRNGKAWSRHLDSIEPSVDLSILPHGYTYVGEYIHTGRPRISEDGAIWKDQFVVFDVLAGDEYYEGLTGWNRQLILDEVIGQGQSMVTSDGISPFLRHLGGDVYRCANLLPKSHEEANKLYTKAICTPLYEGLFVKPKGYRLKYEHREYNNKGYGLRWRKPNNSYRI